MIQVTDRYVEGLPPIYRDILKSFFLFNPQHRVGERVAMQSFYSVLRDEQYTLAQIRSACEKMEQAGVVRISDKIFVEPTDLGKQLIAHIEVPVAAIVPDFPPLETAQRDA
jgi:hypothetical protein